MEQRYIVAIEIGSSVIKGALGVVDRNGILSVTAIEEERLVDSVRYGIIQNGEEVGTRIQRIIARLERNTSLGGRRITGCYVSLGGRGLVSASTEVVREFVADTELTDETIRGMITDAQRTPMADREVIEVIPNGYTVDKLSVPNPVGAFGRNVVGRYTIIGTKHVMRRNLQRVVEEKVGLKIVGGVTRITAQGDMTLTADERRLGCMLVDLGAETTTIAIYKGGSMLYAATLPIGSRNITRDLTSLNCTEERAEELKKAVANAFPNDGERLGSGTGVDGIDYTEINNYVRARAGEIVTNIIEQPRFAGIRMADLPAGIIIVGRGAKLRGLTELLSNNSKARVRCGSPSPGIRVTCASAQPNDSVDVIATLARAAALPVRDILCVEEPEPEPPAEDTDGTDTGYEEPEPKSEPRTRRRRGFFSRLFGGDDEEEIIGGPDEDDLLAQKREEEQRRRRREEEQAAERERRDRERAERDRERADRRRRREEEEEQREESKTFVSIKSKLAKILEDPESLSRGND